MKTYINFSPAITVMASIVLSSCATTQLSHVWRDATFAAGPLQRILVVAVRTNQERRRIWEDGFVTALAGQGVAATPSYRVIPETLPDTGRVNTIAREQKFDGILLVGRVSRTTTESVTASMDFVSQQSPSNPWRGWNYAYFDRANYPGYPVVDDIAKDEVRVWAVLGEGQMIWTGLGEVVDTDGEEDVSGTMISLIVPELVKRRVVGSGS